jgi:hypothetical protein
VKPVPLMGEDVQILKGMPVYNELRVIHARGCTFSAWVPSDEDLAALNEGKPLWVVITGWQIPTFSLVAGDRSELVPKGDPPMRGIAELLKKHDDPKKRALVEPLLEAADDAYWQAKADLLLNRALWILVGFSALFILQVARGLF